MDLKQTLNLPHAEAGIPMKADLVNREPERQKKWNEANLYDSLMKHRKGAPSFVLHDGPPYTNGPIHLGTALNKILKDFVLKSQGVLGKRAPYVPGYDNHGLPIEQAVLKKFAEKKIAPTILELRKACREHAEFYIQHQTEQFSRLGIFGTWDKPYTSMEFSYEAELIRVFQRLVEGGYIYRGLRSVLWSPTSRTALAETETEYHDHVSTAIYVAFPLRNDPENVFGGLENVSCVIWTTTPWTIPANVAVAFHPEFEYDVIRSGDRHLVILRELVDRTLEKVGLPNDGVAMTLTGKQLESTVFKHPIFDRDSRAVLADYVTTEDGTGIVHTAPGHGREDFATGQKYGLAVLCPVDEKGVMTEEALEFQGHFYRNVEPIVIERMRELGTLLHSEPHPHKYPYAERDGNPVIFRATEQWFIGVDHPFHLEPSKTLRQKMLEEIDGCKWYPGNGYDRIKGMIAGRPDWCISRQRPWGVGLPIFYGAESGKPVLDPIAVAAVADLIEKRGSDAWYEVSAAEILPAGYKHPETGETEFRKEVDVFDVWFDSGATHLCVLEGNVHEEWKEELPADLYLEGSDQHRGWFNVSLILGTACRGAAPYRAVVTHGMVTDDQGRKQSKRLGNVVDPVKVCDSMGADVLRTWAASVNFEDDMPCTDALLKTAGELYRTVRNTLRFLLMNLYDYEESDPKELDLVDRWIVQATDKLGEDVSTLYSEYEFTKAFSAIHNFCVNELSRFYLDAIKDKMYCDKANSPARRGAQKACFEVAKRLTILVAPIIPHTADEAYERLPGNRLPSIFHEDLPATTAFDSELDRVVKRLMEIRSDVAAKMESWKSEYGVKDSQDIDIRLSRSAADIEFLNAFGSNLANLFRVASVELSEGEERVEFSASELLKCARSRVRRADVMEVEWQGERIPLSARDRAALGI